MRFWGSERPQISRGSMPPDPPRKDVCFVNCDFALFISIYFIILFCFVLFINLFCFVYFDIFEPVLENEIKHIAKAFPSGKAIGYDNISMSAIKLSIDLISRPLTHIVNLSLANGFVPDEMKIARVIPLYKAENKLFVNNYRPISILPAFSKILEKVFYKRLSNYLNTHNILCANQYGFRKGHSTSLALVDLYDRISEAIDKKEYAVGIFLDLSKAFDTRWTMIFFLRNWNITVYVA